jgi:hypothetical protein
MRRWLWGSLAGALVGLGVWTSPALAAGPAFVQTQGSPFLVGQYPTSLTFNPSGGLLAVGAQGGLRGGSAFVTNFGVNALTGVDVQREWPDGHADRGLGLAVLRGREPQVGGVQLVRGSAGLRQQRR